MLVLDPWDVVAIVAVLLILVGAAVAYWPLALILCGGLMLGAYTVRELRDVAASPVPAEPKRQEPE